MKRLLIVVDFQKDFVDGSLGFPEAVALDEIISQKIADRLANGDDLIFTLDTHTDQYLSTHEGEKLPVKHCVRGTAGHELYGNVAKMRPFARMVFEKPAFPSLELANYLKMMHYDEVELCGLVSNICVLSNAVMVRAALPNAVIQVDRLATASYDRDLNDKALDIMKGLQVDILNDSK